MVAFVRGGRFRDRAVRRPQRLRRPRAVRARRARRARGDDRGGDVRGDHLARRVSSAREQVNVVKHGRVFDNSAVPDEA